MTLGALSAVMPTEASGHDDLREEHDRLALLLELTNSLVSTLELQDVLTAVMQNARRLMRSDSAVVALPDSDGSDGLRGDDLLDGEHTVAAQVFRTGTPWVGQFADMASYCR